MVGCFRVIAAAASIALTAISARAQELPPLTDDMLNLKAAIDRDVHAMPIHPVVLPNIEFDTIAPHVVITFDLLERFGLVAAGDRAALTEHAQQVVNARLEELGVRNDITVTPGPSGPSSLKIDCGTLGLMFDFQAKELPTEHGPVIAVVVDSVLWQGLTVTHPDGSRECLGNSPPASEIAGRALLVLERGQREKALAEFREAILRTVDFAVLRRVLNTNASAYDQVESWVQSAN